MVEWLGVLIIWLLLAPHAYLTIDKPSFICHRANGLTNKQVKKKMGMQLTALVEVGRDPENVKTLF